MMLATSFPFRERSTPSQVLLVKQSRKILSVKRIQIELNRIGLTYDDNQVTITIVVFADVSEEDGINLAKTTWG